MNLLRALRSVRRRHLVVPAAVAAIVLTASVPAWADEPLADDTLTPLPPPAPPAAPPPSAVAPPAAPASQDGNPDPHVFVDHRSYGWQTILADGAALTATLALASSGGAAVGAVSYVTVAPIIHLAHGRPGAAAGSLALRLALPVAGGYLGLEASQGCSGDFCELGGLAIGFAVGVVAASVIDAAALASETVTFEDGKAARRAVSRATPLKPKPITFSPIAGPRRGGGFDVGVGATF